MENEAEMPENQGWTVESLQVTMDQQIAGLERELDQRFTALKTDLEHQFEAAQRAGSAAMAATNERLAGMNEFRDALKDSQANNVSRDEYISGLSGLQAQITTLGEQQRSFLTRGEYAAGHSSLDEKITALTDRMNKSEGLLAGGAMTRGNMFAALAALGVVIGIVVTLFKWGLG